MGSFMDFQFSSLEPAFPIEVFISVVEHEANTLGLDNKGTINLALGHLSPKDLKGSNLASICDWPELKVQLIKCFGQSKVSTKQKMESIFTLSKKPVENCHHYLIRCRHMANLVSSQEEWTEILFLMGLSTDERSMFDLENLPDMPQICKTINAWTTTDCKGDDLIVKTENVDVEISDIAKHEFEDVKYPVTEGDLLKDPYFGHSDADQFQSISDDDAPLSTRKKAIKTKQRNMIKSEDPDFMPDDFNGDNESLSDNSDEDFSLVPKHSKSSNDKSVGKKRKGPGKKSRLQDFKPSSYAKREVTRRKRPYLVTIRNKTKHSAKCESCDYVALSKGDMDDHVRQNHREDVNLHECQICQEMIPLPGTWGHRKHFIQAHGGNEVKCDQCDEIFPTMAQLNKHMRNLHSAKSQYLQDKATRGEIAIIKNPEQTPLARPIRPVDLRAEERKKTRSVVKLIQCALCPSIIEGCQNFTTHFKEKHDGNRFQCDQCDYRTNVWEDLRAHRLSQHNMVWGEGPLYICKIKVKWQNGGECGFKRQYMADFLNHLKVVHEAERSHECNVCGKTFKSVSTLNQHIKNSHLTVKKRFACPFEGCNFTADYQQQVDHHQDVHRDPSERLNTVICPQCGVTYRDQHSLNHHVKRVHLKERNFQCNHCEMSFFNRRQLLGHVSDRHEEKKFFCPECNKGFGRKTPLIKHIRVIHMNVKQFRCTLCNQSFQSSCNLSYHVGRKHMGFGHEEAKKKRHLARSHPAFEKLAEDKEIEETLLNDISNSIPDLPPTKRLKFGQSGVPVDRSFNIKKV